MERNSNQAYTQEVSLFERGLAQYRIRELLRQELRTSVLNLVSELFKDEVEEICGVKHARDHANAYRRGGSDPHGVIHLEGQRVRVPHPRVRKGDQEYVLQTYRALKSFDLLGEPVMRQMIRGVSTRDYKDTVREIAGGLGLSKSSVSRAFVRASQKDLDQINGRDLSELLFVALYVDGIQFAGVDLIVGMGITDQGRKVLLGLVEGHTENAELCLALIESVIARGLKIPARVLLTIDGAKALRSAAKRTWGDRVEIQRCQIHKMRNVLKHLPKPRYSELRRRLHVAYNLEEVQEAEKMLRSTVSWLRGISDMAASSLEEGLEETLTVVRMRLPAMLRKTLASTNPLESVFSAVRQRTRNVKRWRRSHRHASRWAASGLLLMEKRLHRIDGYKSLSVLLAALANKNVDLEKKVG